MSGMNENKLTNWNTGWNASHWNLRSMTWTCQVPAAVPLLPGGAPEGQGGVREPLKAQDSWADACTLGRQHRSRTRSCCHVSRGSALCPGVSAVAHATCKVLQQISVVQVPNQDSISSEARVQPGGQGCTQHHTIPLGCIQRRTWKPSLWNITGLLKGWKALSGQPC